MLLDNQAYSHSLKSQRMHELALAAESLPPFLFFGFLFFFVAPIEGSTLFSLLESRSLHFPLILNSSLDRTNFSISRF